MHNPNTRSKTDTSGTHQLNKTDQKNGIERDKSCTGCSGCTNTTTTTQEHYGKLGQISKLGQTTNWDRSTNWDRQRMVLTVHLPYNHTLQHCNKSKLGQTNRLGQINRPGQINKLGQIDKLGKRQTQWYKVFTPLQPHTLANWARQHNGPD